jgi:alpha-glucosidase
MGYCVKNSQGEDYLITTTDFPSALLDLTNPEGVKWIKSIIKDNMINIGLDGWMADYGEYLPPDAILHSGISGEEFHNRYPAIWAKIQYETIKEENKLEEILYFHRSNYSHGSKYVMLYWPGDQTVDWSEESGLPCIIKCGMSLGLSGVGNYSFDIGGFLTTDSIKRNKEIFLRWIELGTFSLVMRTHEGNRPYDNWQFDSDDETLQIISKMVKIHKKLKPYLKFLESEYQETGIPPIRPCFLHYEDDKELYNLNYQYLLGRDMLIAPVYISGSSDMKIYFPDDIWIHLWSLDEYKKGYYTINCPIGKPPVFFRKSSQFIPLFRDLIHSE